MEAIFLKLVNMSITASWLVLVIIAVRLIFKKTPKWILCLLWGLVAFRLICPFSIESALSLIPSAEPLPREIIYTAEPQIHSGVSSIDSTVNPMLESSMTPVALTSANPTQIWSFILSQVWILGMILMFAYTVGSYLLLKRKVATAIPVKKGIKQSEHVDSPFVLGIIRPVIYLPFGMAEGDMSYVIAHERAHIRRRDHWWKPLGFLLLSIYWFNPLLWLAYILLCRDIEAACDEKVIRDMDKDDRRAYSTALLNCSIHRRTIAACPLAFGEVGVKTRVRGVMNYKKPAFWFIIISVVVVIIVSVCFLTDPESASPVTMRVDYFNRTEADLHFYYDKAYKKETCKISEDYTLEVLENGKWLEIENLSEAQPAEAVHSIVSEEPDFDAWSSLNWEAHYGKLPDGRFRIRKYITIDKGVKESETLPVYAEFTIGGTAEDFITYTLGEITPTGAKLYEKETVDEHTQLIYDGGAGFWLEALQDGQWKYVEPTEFIEPAFREDRHYIYQLIYPSKYTQLDWSSLYGELPGGNYRIAREITYISEADARLCTVYAEFTIGEEMPVSISLKNVLPTGATVLLHQNQELTGGEIMCGKEFFIQKSINGEWVDLPTLTEHPFPAETFDLALLRNFDVDWESMYGSLPVGVYRLGKEIPTTIGEKKEHITVYAEFSIDRVFTWFDMYSTGSNAVGGTPNHMELFGTEGVSIQVSSIENIQIAEYPGDRYETVIHGGNLIRNIFLTDLTGDGISEICATTSNGQVQIQVYDYAAGECYTLEDENLSYVLAKKADRLLVLKREGGFSTKGYGQLALNGGKLEIREIDPALIPLTQTVSSVDLWTRKSTSLSSQEDVEHVISLLRDMENKVLPASQEEYAAVQEDPFYISYIKINYELGDKVINFSRNFELVWENDSTIAYRILDPDPIRKFMESMTDGVRGKETSGEPFSTMDSPWDWCASVQESAVETAQVHVCLSTYIQGVVSGATSTSGILSSDTLNSLIKVLNQIPRSSFTPWKMTSKQSYHDIFVNQKEQNSSISIIDGVNDLGVTINYRNGKLTMLLTDEMDKVRNNDFSYLEPTQQWTVQDENLLSFMESLRENPLVINYSVGAEYDWQKALNFSSGSFDVKLWLIEGWEHEYVANDTNSGIRCRPEGIRDGWIYFSYWPEGYQVEEENRYYGEGSQWGYRTITSFPGSVKSKMGVDTRNAIWSYKQIKLNQGDLVIINQGADNWFPDYKDQIEDTITLMNFKTE